MPSNDRFQPLPVLPVARPLPFFAQGMGAQQQAMAPRMPPNMPPSLGFTGQGWYTPARQQAMFNQLTQGGLSPQGSQALMSHMMNVESRDLGPSAFNPAGGGHGAMGMGQWRGPRQAGVTLGDAPGQTQHILSELSSPYFRGESSVLRNPNATASQAARAGEQYFEGTGSRGRLNPNYLARTQAGMQSIGRPMGRPPMMGAGFMSPRTPMMSPPSMSMSAPPLPPPPPPPPPPPMSMPVGK